MIIIDSNLKYKNLVLLKYSIDLKATYIKIISILNNVNLLFISQKHNNSFVPTTSMQKNIKKRNRCFIGILLKSRKKIIFVINHLASNLWKIPLQEIRYCQVYKIFLLKLWNLIMDVLVQNLVLMLKRFFSGLVLVPVLSKITTLICCISTSNSWRNKGGQNLDVAFRVVCLSKVIILLYTNSF